MSRRTGEKPRDAWVVLPQHSPAIAGILRLRIPRSAAQPERYPAMLARSIPGVRALPLVMAAACLSLLPPAANAAEAGFRKMTVTAHGADDKPAPFSLYYPTTDAARPI